MVRCPEKPILDPEPSTEAGTAKSWRRKLPEVDPAEIRQGIVRQVLSRGKSYFVYSNILFRKRFSTKFLSSRGLGITYHIFLSISCWKTRYFDIIQKRSDLILSIPLPDDCWVPSRLDDLWRVSTESIFPTSEVAERPAELLPEPPEVWKRRTSCRTEALPAGSGLCEGPHSQVCFQPNSL